ncbi:MAG: hypothetical protein IKC75_02490 [Clostridia bacterium]|nr:hypothetical protein [Clostridia bacterium]
MKRILLFSLLLVLVLALLVSCTPSNGNEPDPDGGTVSYTYTAFTGSEKANLTALVGELIPFIPNNEYYFDLLTEDGEQFIRFYTKGNTESEFEAFRAALYGYTLTETATNENGDTEYRYVKGDIHIHVSYHLTSVNVLIYREIASGGDQGGNQGGGDQGGDQGGGDQGGDQGSGDQSGNQGGGDQGGDQGGGDQGNTPGKANTAFTASEVEALTALVGEAIPYLANDEYYFESRSDEYGAYINFYTLGNTEAEFNTYRTAITAAGYALSDTEVDEYGDTWYYYDKGDICIDVAYYIDENDHVVDVYIYLYVEEGGDTGGNEGSEGGDTDGNQGSDTDDFTASEKSMFISYVGETIPFLIADTYYIDDYRNSSDPCINYYTYGNTQTQFDLYRAKLELAGYELSETEVDEYGDTWYYYTKGDIYLDLAYYETDSGYVVDVYVYPASDAGSGDDGQGGNGGGNAYPDGSNVITNDGAGLPTDADGVHDVDFTGAANVKDVTDQFDYIDGCPTTGSPKVLVIPVEFSDVTAASRGYDIAKLYTAFSSDDPNDGICSVYEYYKISSYGKLTVDFTVIGNWFKPRYDSTYYADSTDTDGYANGDQLIIDEALAYLATIMDLSEFDSDENKVIDAVVIVHTLDIDSTKDFYWAYRYWNYHVDADGYYYEYDGVSANDYLWASFDFLHEEYDFSGNLGFDNDDSINTYTFIHEFGHVLGADDYYDTSRKTDGPLDGMDIMDGMFGDHNAFTKFNYGWLTTSRLVVCEGSITLTLEAFAKNGDTILIANNWDDTLGAYQEYYIIVYYTAEGLNAEEDAGYFERDGIIVYHINASLYSEVYEGETYYNIYNNNTDASDNYGSVNNLIEYVQSTDGTYTYVVGDTMGRTFDDAGNALAYNFVVDSINGNTATLTFTKVQ